MDFSLPGQLGGPECKRIMSRAVLLRKTIEDWFARLENDAVDSFTVILRVDGSIHKFGVSGVESIKLRDKALECDLIIADTGWDDQSDAEIDEILRDGVRQAIRTCFRQHNIQFNPTELDGLIYGGD